jgi:hypothetical protein
MAVKRKGLERIVSDVSPDLKARVEAMAAARESNVAQEIRFALRDRLREFESETEQAA